MADLPIYQNREQVEVPQMPEFEPSAEKLGESQNNLSAIGSKVAQVSSNQMAEQLGQASGKNPKGDQLPPVTEFDKNFNEAYTTQADATLTVQGQTLLDQASLSMSKASRLTPDLIAQSNKNVSAGLAKIAENAPTAIKTKLQASFSSQMLQQNKEFSQKMIAQQKEDQTNNTNNGLDILARNSYDLSLNGDPQGAQNAVDRIKKITASAVASRFITPEEARIKVETAEQNVLSGHYNAAAKYALDNGTYDKFEDEYSRKDPKELGMTNEQYQATGAALKQQAAFYQNLREQNQNLTAQQFLNRVAGDPTKISGADIEALRQNLSPMKFEQVQYRYIQAMKKATNRQDGEQYLTAHWDDPEAHAASTPKVQDAAYIKSVDYAVQQSAAKGEPLSHEDAEVMVAAHAGAPIPVFIRDLKNKISSGNPAMIESAAYQVHALDQMQSGGALKGLDDKDRTIIASYESLRDSKDPVTAAQDAKALNSLDSDTEKANKEAWTNHLRQSTSGTNQSDPDFALSHFGFNPNQFVTPEMANSYGTDILQKYASIYQLSNRNLEVAEKVTQQYIDRNYGDTRINGGIFKIPKPYPIYIRMLLIN
jgi:hypothetical protein